MKGDLRERTLRLFERPATVRGGPYIAILGPMGSGKTQLIEWLQGAIDRDPAIYEVDLQVRLDLLSLRLGSVDELFSQVFVHFLTCASTLVGTVTEVPRRAAQRHFATVLEGILRSFPGRCVLHIDHLDRVPRFFARALARQLYHVVTNADERPEFRRLAFVVAGRLSLFHLRHQTNSPFQSCETVLLPPLDSETRQQLVRERLDASGLIYREDSVIETLAEGTAGEPCFLGPIVESLARKHSGGTIRGRDCEKAIEECAAAGAQPELRDLGLSLYDDSRLRSTVRELHAKGGRIPRREFSVDIDRCHVLGAVIPAEADEQNPVGYRWRNGIIRRYAAQLLDTALAPPGLLDDDQVAFSGSPEYRGSDALPMIEHLLLLEQLKSELTQSTNLSAIRDVLASAWMLTTTCGSAAVSLYVLDKQQNAVMRIEDSRGGVARLVYARKGRYRDAAAIGAISRRVPYFTTSQAKFAVGVPVQAEDAQHAVVVSVARHRADEGFSEAILLHWIRFVVVSGNVIVKAVCARLWMDSPDSQSRALAELATTSRRGGTHTDTCEAVGGGLVCLTLLRDYGAIISDGRALRVIRSASLASQDKLLDDLNNRCHRLGVDSNNYTRLIEDLQGVATEVDQLVQRAPQLGEYLSQLRAPTEMVLAGQL